MQDKGPPGTFLGDRKNNKEKANKKVKMYLCAKENLERSTFEEYYFGKTIYMYLPSDWRTLSYRGHISLPGSHSCYGSR